MKPLKAWPDNVLVAVMELSSCLKFIAVWFLTNGFFITQKPSATKCARLLVDRFEGVAPGEAITTLFNR